MIVVEEIFVHDHERKYMCHKRHTVYSSYNNLCLFIHLQVHQLQNSVSENERRADKVSNRFFFIFFEYI